MDEEKEISIDSENGVSININEFDSMWSPYDNNLRLEQKLIIENHIYYSAKMVSHVLIIL